MPECVQTVKVRHGDICEKGIARLNICLEPVQCESCSYSVQRSACSHFTGDGCCALVNHTDVVPEMISVLR